MFKKYTVARICRCVGLSVALAGAAVLSGCATPTVAARVTSFQHWPDNSPRSPPSSAPSARTS
ncbi:MAG: DUF4136 domain-containing protein, partial [Bordetella sp.]|nr:DUF4136 domain-containing protein [Bordetella sp.]